MQPAANHLSDLSTSWTLLIQAHQGAEAERKRARDTLIQRYRVVVRRYLGGALRHEPNAPTAVDDCEQECWKRLVEGRFQGANPQRGRFRDYLRAVLSNLVNDQRRQRRQAPGELGEVASPLAEPFSDDEYRKVYGAELLRRALERLRLQDEQTGQGFHAVLLTRRDHTEDSMEELARRLSQPEQEQNANWVRQMLYRARRHLCELIRLEVAGELSNPTREAVDEELAELGLLVYCQEPG
jgi:RNA polymerase sigma-70 factor (ECF subfamily)